MKSVVTRHFTLLVALLCTLPSPTNAKATRDVLHYHCAGGESFTVARNRSSASVSIAGRTYQLTRKPSSLGQQFRSPTATLIVDGSFAAFATERLFHLRDCFEVGSIAERG